MRRPILLLLAAISLVSGCATVRALAPGGIAASAPTSAHARAEMTDRLALGYAMVAAYAAEIRLGVDGGHIEARDAQSRIDRLKDAKAMLDVASQLYLGGEPAAAEARLRVFDAAMLELRAWLERKGEKR